MSVSMVSENNCKSKKERTFNSRPNCGKRALAWHCHRSWPKSSQTFCDIFALCCCLQQRAKTNELAGRIIIGDVASKGPDNVITGIPAKFVAGAFGGPLHFSFAASIRYSLLKDSIEANLARAKLEAKLHRASTPEVGGPKSCARGRTRASPACFKSLCLGSRSPRKRKGVSFLDAEERLRKGALMKSWMQTGAFLDQLGRGL